MMTMSLWKEMEINRNCLNILLTKIHALLKCGGANSLSNSQKTIIQELTFRSNKESRTICETYEQIGKIPKRPKPI